MPDPEGYERLDSVFSILLSLHLENDLDDFEDCFLQSYSLEQELAAKLLLTTHYKLKYRLEEAARIEKDYLSLFVSEMELPNFPRHLKKYWLIYQFASQIIEADFEACEKTLALLDEYLIREGDVFFLQCLLSFVFLESKTFGKAFKAIEKAHYLANKLNVPIYKIKAAGLKILLLIYLDELEEASIELERCQKFIAFHGNDRYFWIVNARQNLLEKVRGDFKASQSSFEKQSCQSYRHVTWLRVRYHSFLLKLHEYFITLNDQEAAAIISEELSNLPRTENEYYHYISNQAFNFLQSGNEKQHAKLQRKAIQYFESRNQVDDQKRLVEIYSKLAEYYLNEHKYKLSASYYRKMNKYI